MTLVDTSILIDVLRGSGAAVIVLQDAFRRGPLHASEITRLEVLAGMRASEEQSTRALLRVLTWHAVDEEIAERAGTLGRAWLPSHHGIDSADLVIAATTLGLGVPLLTRNVKHFPMFPALAAPY